MLTRSIRCHTLSEDIRDLTLESHSLEKPAQDEVQIAIHACAVNFPDILMAQGRYQFKPPLPFAPGGALRTNAEFFDFMDPANADFPYVYDALL